MSDTSLAFKLKLKPGLRAAIINMPDDYLVQLAPERVTIERSLVGKYDWIQVFVKRKFDLDELFPQIAAALNPESLLWISFPKGTSGIQTDLARDQGWDSVVGLKWLNLVSINLTWSAFSLRPFRPDENAKIRQ